MTPIFEGQPTKTRPFPIKTMVIWVPGIYTIYISRIRDIILPKLGYLQLGFMISVR